MKKLNLKKLQEEEAKEQYNVKISNRYAALEDLDAVVNMNTRGYLQFPALVLPSVQQL
jgi:hypothetical protein